MRASGCNNMYDMYVELEGNVLYLRECRIFRDRSQLTVADGRRCDCTPPKCSRPAQEEGLKIVVQMGGGDVRDGHIRKIFGKNLHCSRSCAQSIYHLYRSKSLLALEKKRLFAVMFLPTIDLKEYGMGDETADA